MRAALLLALLLAGKALALEVRVLVASGPELEVALDGPHTLWTPGGPLAKSEGPARYRVRLADGWVVVSGKRVGGKVSFVPRSGGFRLGTRRYPGFLRVIARDGRLLAVNVVEIEDYLAGVLPGEMPAWFPLEALKAQAVIARTYALGKLGSDPDYDLTADSQHQVYLGTATHPAYRRAVRASRERVLAYRGALARAVYHADYGGTTASSLEVWGRSFPYLVSRPDPYTRARSWTFSPGAAAVARALSAAGFELGRVRGMEVVWRTGSGRVGGLRISGDRGQILLEVPQVTSFLRGLGLPSTLAELTGPLSFRGRGEGHGVGLSQWGAKGMAERGFNFREILGHYYPGTALAPYVVEAPR